MTQREDWDAATSSAAQALDEQHAVVIVAGNPDDAAAAALAIARAQARRRRVAVADLVGELPALERLLPEGSEHGIVDCFAHGVSLNQVAQPVDPARNLFILPSGAGPMEHASILRSDRWPRLASGFREVDALLIAVVAPGAPGLPSLLAAFDGHVAVGDVEVSPAHGLLARVTPPRALAAVAAPDDAATEDAAQATEAAPDVPRRRPGRRELVPIAGAAAALLILAALGALLINPTRGREPTPAVVAEQPPTDIAEALGVTAPMDTLPAVTVANPADSARAAAYSVQLASHTGMTSALAHVEIATDRHVQAVTYSPVITGAANARWYRVLAGAFVSAEGADSLLGQLRRAGSLEAQQGEVRHAPYALLVERAIAREQTSVYLRDYRSRGLPAYALLQDDGTVHIYAGAFETPEQAALLLATFRERGEEPLVVYRTGRGF